MDEASQIGGVLGIIITVVGVVYGAINHKRLRSTCCGRKIDISVDIESTSPQAVRHVNVKPRQEDENVDTAIKIKSPLPTENGRTTQAN